MIGRGTAAGALEAEGGGHDADRQRTELARDARDDGGGSGAGAPALAGSDEDHVGPPERRLQLVGRILGGLPADRRIGAGAEAVRDGLADVDLRRRVRDRERLEVGVDRDEVHLCDTRVHHPVDRVQPRTADTDRTSLPS